MKNILFFFSLITFSFYSQNNTLKLLSGEYILENNIDKINEQTYAALDFFDNKYYGVIQFSSIPNNNTKELIEKNGITLLSYLPEKAYFVSFAYNTSIEAIKNIPNIRGLYNVLPEYKIHPKLSNNKFPDYIYSGSEILIVASFYKNIDRNKAINELEELNFNIIDDNKERNVITLKIKTNEISILSNQTFISFIEPIDPTSVAENKTAKTLHRSNYINSPLNNGLHYDGTGVNVMMQDDGTIGPHIDYQGREDQSNLTTNSGDHGDHVAGTIMGAGNLDPQAEGMAPGAFLYVFSSANTNYNSVPAMYQNQNLVITSKSYSNGCNAGYTTLTNQLDQQVRNYPSLIHVFSAGNSGTSDCGYGAGASWGNITGGHKAGKNVLCVGNLTENDVIANSSSRGPAADGRIKPDICAKGTNVYSTIDGNTYANKTGTSMSCPGIAGNVTQLYHVYRDLNSGQDPKSALIKASLLNTADDLGNPGPDFIYGWGRVNLRKAYNTLLNNNYFYDSLDNGNSSSYTINVPSGQKKLKIMIHWTDYEASTSASTALVNDLDMVVSNPAGTNILPWVLNSSPNASALNSNATRGADHLNNMEQVTINNPSSGTYTINVDGFNIPNGPQNFYIVYQYINDDITLTYPNGGEPFVPGEIEKIRWDTYSNTGNFSLDYSLDSGVTWTNISTNISGSLRYFNWTVPSSVISGNALIKISRASLVDRSDACFSIIDVPTNITSLTSCTGDLTISWDPVANATGYNIFMLGTKYMDSVGFSNTNQFTITGITASSVWVSVNAVGVDDAYGRRAIAVELQPSSSSAATVSSFSSSGNGTCDTIFSTTFANNSVNASTFLWDFGDGNTSTSVNPSHTYTSAGIFDVSLIAYGGTCGNDTTISLGYISVGQLASPIVNDINLCMPDSVQLSAVASGAINWYNQASGGNIIANGQTFTTPFLNSTTTYYAQANNAGGTYNVGPTDNSFGNGGYFNNGGRHLVFDAYTDFTLKSVWVDADGTANRTIELRDNNGNILSDTTINIANGQGRVTLNFFVPQGSNYQLGVNVNSTPDLFRNNANVSYPYTLQNVASITQSNANTATAFYYFFYDWEVEVKSCSSSVVPITISVIQEPIAIDDSSCGPDSLTLQAIASGSGQLNWYSSASSTTILGSGSNFNTPLLNASTYYYVNEIISPQSIYGGPFDNSIGTGAYFNGDQHMVFDCLSASTLKSVKVFAGSSANRTIELRNNNGNVIKDTTIFLASGESRAILNFDIPVGNNYQLGVQQGSSPDLYRNNTGPAYPYNIGSLLEITNSSAGLTGSPGYYYFFYDWEVAEPDCETSRTRVAAVINNSNNVSIDSVSNICYSDSAFNLSTIAVGGIWSGPGIIDTINGLFDPNIAGIGTSQVSYLTFGSCSGGDTINIIVDSVFNPTISAVSSVCSNAPSFNLNSSINGGIWSGAGIIDSINGTLSPNLAGAGTHTISYTISGVCGGLTQQNVTIDSSADATILTSSSYCSYDDIDTLQALNSGGIWSGNGITNSTLGTFDPGLLTSGNYVITYSILGVCGDVQTTNISVNHSDASFILPLDSMCSDDNPINISSNQSGGTWSGNGISNPLIGTFDPNLAGAGLHTITYTITPPCPDTHSLDILVQQTAYAQITNVSSICETANPIQLVASPTGGVWSGNGITNSANGTFDPSSAGIGSHLITYTISGNCGDYTTTYVVVDNCSDITNNQEENISYYPNPTKNIINIDLNNIKENGKINIVINDIAGKEVYKTNFTITKGNNSVKINIPSYVADGTYFIKSTGIINNVTSLIIHR